MSIVNYGVCNLNAGSQVSDRCPLGYLFNVSKSSTYLYSTQNLIKITITISTGFNAMNRYYFFKFNENSTKSSVVFEHAIDCSFSKQTVTFSKLHPKV